MGTVVQRVVVGDLFQLSSVFYGRFLVLLLVFGIWGKENAPESFFCRISSRLLQLWAGFFFLPSVPAVFLGVFPADHNFTRGKVDGKQIVSLVGDSSGASEDIQSILVDDCGVTKPSLNISLEMNLFPFFHFKVETPEIIKNSVLILPSIDIDALLLKGETDLVAGFREGLASFAIIEESLPGEGLKV